MWYTKDKDLSSEIIHSQAGKGLDMTFTEKLDGLMAERHLSRAGLSRASGIPYTTIIGFYEKGAENIKLSTLRRLADFFQVPVGYLAGDPAAAAAPAHYGELSPKGQQLVDNFIDALKAYEAPVAEAAPVTYLREYVTPAAAGYASPAEGEDYVLIPRPAEAPAGTDFAVRIAGDSMEPYIHDNDRVFVSRMSELSIGDVGIFFVDGDIKCKQYCEDHLGNVYLLSLNRARRDADVHILASSGVTLFCFGKVLLPRRPPLPNI